MFRADSCAKVTVESHGQAEDTRPTPAQTDPSHTPRAQSLTASPTGHGHATSRKTKLSLTGELSAQNASLVFWSLYSALLCVRVKTLERFDFVFPVDLVDNAVLG